MKPQVGLQTIHPPWPIALQVYIIMMVSTNQV